MSRELSRESWRIVWPALRALGYQRAAQCYGTDNLETAWQCFLARHQAESGPYPWNPLSDRLRAFKLGYRPMRLRSFNPPLPLP